MKTAVLTSGIFRASMQTSLSKRVLSISLNSTIQQIKEVSLGVNVQQNYDPYGQYYYEAFMAIIMCDFITSPSLRFVYYYVYTKTPRVWGNFAHSCLPLFFLNTAGITPVFHGTALQNETHCYIHMLRLSPLS